MKRQGLRRPSEMSPLEVLGAGRVDPFLSYPVEDADKSLHEVMDLSKPTFFCMYYTYDPQLYVSFLILA
jgi:hypothetical protein